MTIAEKGKHPEAALGGVERWGASLLVLVLLLSAPLALAYDVTTVSPGRVRPQDLAASLAWSAASGTLCDDAEAQADVAIVNRETDLDQADTAPACAALAPHAGAALVAAGVAPPATTTGAAASDPVDGATAARAEVEAVGFTLRAGLGDGARYQAPSQYPPAVLDGAREEARIGARGGDGPIASLALPADASRLDPDATREGASSPGPRAPAPARPVPPAGADAPPVLQGALVAAGAFALAVAAAVLYQRIGAHGALQHPGRAALYEAVKACPEGAPVGTLAQSAGMTRKTAEYHLLYLARAGLVASHAAPGEPRRWTLAASRPAPGADDALAALVRANPGVTTARLADLAGMTRSRVDRRAKALVLRGALVARAQDGERRFFAP